MNTPPNNEASDTPQATSDHKENAPTPSEVVKAAYRLLDAGHKWLHRNADREKSKFADWVLVGLTFFIAIAAFWTAFIFEHQLSLMRDADRPWIDMDIFITSPLTYDGKAVQVEFTFVPTNIGRSPARNIAINPMLKPAFMFDDLNEIQKHLCDNAATEVGMASLKYVLFPGHHYRQPVGLSLSVEDINSHWGKLPPGVGPSDAIPIALVGCVDYTYESSNRHHQTAFAVDVLTKDGVLPLKSKTPLTPGDLILRSHPTTGHYPN